MLIRALPFAVQHPFFWLLTAIVFFQYARVADLEKRLYGSTRHNPLTSTLVSLVFGIGIGFFGSLALVVMGPIVNDAGIIYVWPLAVILMLLSPRMLCFAYAGGILSLVHLVFGVPKIGVPQLLTIIAVLHLVESVLIWIDGYYGAIPGFFRLSDGHHTGGYLLQRFWIVPLALTIAVPTAADIAAEGGIEMPYWWPLIKSGAEKYIEGAFSLTISPIPVILGYGDFSFSRMPHKKVQLTSGASLVYSLVLLALAIGADRYELLAYAAAVFAPLGHELVIGFGRRVETIRDALFSLPNRGVRVLDVLAKSQSFEKGVRAGDVILSVNGVPVSDVTSVRRASMLQGGIIDLDLLSNAEGSARYPSHLRIRLNASDPRSGLGILLLPTPGEAPYISLDRSGRLVSNLRSLLRRLFRSGGREE